MLPVRPMPQPEQLEKYSSTFVSGTPSVLPAECAVTDRTDFFFLIQALTRAGDKNVRVKEGHIQVSAVRSSEANMSLLRTSIIALRAPALLVFCFNIKCKQTSLLRIDFIFIDFVLLRIKTTVCSSKRFNFTFFKQNKKYASVDSVKHAC